MNIDSAKAARAIANAMQFGTENVTANEALWLEHLIETNGECGCFLTRCEECRPDSVCAAAEARRSGVVA
jgi:hypothetical protein